MPATKTHQHAPSTKTECDYLNGWIKKNKTVTYAKISPKNGEPQRRSWGTQKKKKKKYVYGTANILFRLTRSLATMHLSMRLKRRWSCTRAPAIGRRFESWMWLLAQAWLEWRQVSCKQAPFGFLRDTFYSMWAVIFMIWGGW